ncbi:gastrin/cholecystokinin type B receptor isoform X2 [Passer domesticus]|uniref:gastrin/cholecystokinin type B receptor isoform X2 n=1 Tax=Passer domesticus TaxID=48849 RepID=UPI0030FE4372
MGLHRARAGHVGAPVSQCRGLCWGAFGCLWSTSGWPPGYPRGALAVSLWRPRECFQSAPGVPRGGSAAPCPAARRAGRGGAGGALRADLRAERRGQRAGGGRAGAEPAAAHRHQLLPAVPGPERPAPGAVLHALHPAARPHGRLRLRRRRLQARGLPHGTTRPAAPRPPPAQCTHHWPSERVRQAWYVLLLLVLFFIPGVVMTVAYGLISRELYRGIRFELDVKGDVAAQRGPGGDPAPACDEGDGCYLQLSRPGAALELRALGAQQDRARINSSGAQLAAKRRVIRMLVVIVAMFFLCWLPIFAANTWRAFAPRAAQRALSGTPIAFIHLLSYTSACANPLIYCFMNRRFRKAFGATCAGWGCRRACPRRPPEDEPPMASASLSKFSYTTVSSLGPP